jgi:3-oxoacid CoA-transferase subunit A
MKDKIVSTFEEAVSDISDGASLMVFHWNLGRSTPRNLIRALSRKGAKDLTLISHNFTPPRVGDYFFDAAEISTVLTLAGQAKKVITAWPGLSSYGAKYKEKSELEKRVASGEIEMELMSHGTLVERMRAGGSGLGGFYTRVGVGTVVEKGKEKRIIDGKEYILEKPLRADFGFVRAYKADKRGNLIYRGAVRGGNPVIAMASDITIAEVDEIVEVGELDPDAIVTPGVFVQRIVKVPEAGYGSAHHMESLFHKALESSAEDIK